MLRTPRGICAAALLAILAPILTVAAGARQANTQLQSPAVQPPANPADVSSPDAILDALYQVISGPAGQKRDWNRFLSLFLPGARLIPTSPKSGGEHAQTLTPADYVARAGPYLEKNGFFENEIARKTERFGGIMQVFSTYQSRHSASDQTPFARGINSIQLFFDGTRWWVVTIFWAQETPSNPLPPEFLPHSRRRARGE